jgi:hypothetical protein
MTETTATETTTDECLLVHIDEDTQTITFADEDDQPIISYTFTTFAQIAGAPAVDAGRALIVPAANVAALQQYADLDARLFVVADAHRLGLPPADPAGCSSKQPRPGDGGWWAAEPGVGRVADGSAGWVDRIRALGNAVVPQVARHVGRLIMDRDAARLDVPHVPAFCDTL